MHKQSGYASAWVNGFGEVAILHKTNVASVLIRTNRLVLNNGGWITRATTKAMNGFLNDQNLTLRVFIKNGEMYLKTADKNIKFVKNQSLVYSL